MRQIREKAIKEHDGMFSILLLRTVPYNFLFRRETSTKTSDCRTNFA